jgi:hypothetical protein
VRDTWAGKIDRVYTPGSVHDKQQERRVQNRVVPLEERKAANADAVADVFDTALGSLPRKKTTNLLVSRVIKENDDGSLTLRVGAFAWEL